jgi:restriction system protein
MQVLGGSATRQEVIAKAVEVGGYGVEQQAMMMPNGRMSRLEYYTGWNLSRLKRIGLADNSGQRGVWALTERGQAASEEDVPALWEEGRLAYLEISRERREQRPDGASDSSDDEESTIGDEEVADSWKDGLLARMKAMDPSAFERLCQRLLREADFEKVVVTGRAGDGGIDGVGLVRLGLLSFPTYFQCKRYDGSVGSGAVRDFRGAMSGRGEKGVIITTGTFSPAARTEATRDGVSPIDLIDGDALCDLLKLHRVGVVVTERIVEDVIVDDQWWDDQT